eukprot:TRINITY_DN29567_c0_g1_i2.p1 TRINITY_DN29567_c0_g1~~TRINITY_DN29567_c0_g1_i2.p1  ORF type:complete len:803 (+),score=254.52 TRINITY_DN29567_c0_g1_i2:97-2409(+)
MVCPACSKRVNSGDPKTYLACGAGKEKSETCKKVMHTGCARNASAVAPIGRANAPSSVVFICPACFPNRMSLDGDAMKAHARSHLPELQSYCVGKVNMDACVNLLFSYPRGKDRNGRSPPGVSSLSFHKSQEPHQVWLKKMLAELKVSITPAPAPSVASSEPKVFKTIRKGPVAGKPGPPPMQAPAPAKPSSTVSTASNNGLSDVIDLDDQESAIADVNSQGKELGDRLYYRHMKGEPTGVNSLHHMPVHSLRVFQGGTQSVFTGGSDGSGFVPPESSSKVYYFDCVTVADAPVHWSIYIRETEASKGVPGSGLQLILHPGKDKWAQGIPLGDIAEGWCRTTEDGVYVHVVMRSHESHHAVKHTKKASREGLYRKASHKKKHRRTTPGVPQGFVPMVSDPACEPHSYVFLCHPPCVYGSDVDGLQSSVESVAQVYLLDKLLRKLKKTGVPLASEGAALSKMLSWASRSAGDILGMQQKLFTYAPETTMDKGYLQIEDYSRLHPQRFLNSTLMNYFLRLVMEDPAVGRDVLVFPTVFVTRLRKVFGQVSGSLFTEHRRKWAMSAANLPLGLLVPDTADGKRQMQRSLFEYNLLVAPVNDSDRAHWTLGAVTNLRSVKSGSGVASFIHCDSLRTASDPMEFKVLMQRFLACRAEAEVTLQTKGLLQGSWASRGEACLKQFSNAHMLEPDVPQQLNSVDCGAHVLIMAELLMRSARGSETAQIGPSWFDASTQPSKLRITLQEKIKQRTQAESPDLMPQLEGVDTAEPIATDG